MDAAAAGSALAARLAVVEAGALAVVEAEARCRCGVVALHAAPKPTLREDAG
jgi:hypothetical protein